MLVLVFIASCVLVFNPVSGALEVGNSWAEKAPMLTARAYLGVAVVNGKIYAIGGSSASETGSCSTGQSYGGQEVNTNEMYDPSSNSWLTESPMPTARASFSIAVYQNLIYCIGGYSTLTSFNPQVTPFPYFDVAANEVYNTATNTWTNEAPMPSPRYSAATAMVDGKIYVIGGSSMNGFLMNNSVSYYNVNQVYNIQTNTWTTKTPPPVPLDARVSAVLDGKIYVLAMNQTWVGNQVLEIYDPANDSWSIERNNIHDFCFTAAATSGVLAPKRIYFFGEQETDIYNPFTGNWTLGTAAPTDRLIASVAVVNDTFYLIGGRTGIWGELTLAYPSTLNEQYTPVGYGTPDPSYLLTVTPPKITVLSIQNQTYRNATLPLAFTVDKEVGWIKYSLDGKANVTVTGNATLSMLSNGAYSVSIFANDTFGNVGASQTVWFTVSKPAPFLSATVAAILVVAAVVVIGIALLVYFKKREAAPQYKVEGQKT
jgi:N-acetylneuraminic acid mutarotase